jgi:hypothetical protein
MPYMLVGNELSTEEVVNHCNFVVVHDFFDTCDSTAISFKPIAQRHDCQILCFNYPGQAHTTWPRVSHAEKESGAKEPVLNNDWIAARLHELLLHVDEAGERCFDNQ